VYVQPAPPPPYYGERPLPYRERSYAEAQPAKPAPKAPAAQPKPMRERYTLSATELFEFDKAELRMPQPKLDEIAAAMKANPEVREVTITGYTDRLGSEAYNLELSMRRAAAVKSYLVGKDVDRDRLKAVGKGEADPVVHCDDTLSRAGAHQVPRAQPPGRGRAHHRGAAGSLVSVAASAAWARRSLTHIAERNTTAPNGQSSCRKRVSVAKLPTCRAASGRGAPAPRRAVVPKILAKSGAARIRTSPR
jgi:outer membrane protein OmpA-like peptidoglycan-associated protein